MTGDIVTVAATEMIAVAMAMTEAATAMTGAAMAVKEATMVGAEEAMAVTEEVMTTDAAAVVEEDTTEAMATDLMKFHRSLHT